jgi:hypothetical protein
MIYSDIAQARPKPSKVLEEEERGNRVNVSSVQKSKGREVRAANEAPW